MATININDDRPQTMQVNGVNRDVAVVRMRCVTCGWDDKCFQREALTAAAGHFGMTHGGNGKIQYKGNYRFVENGRILRQDLGNINDEDN